jgi:hypothetical protein
MWGFIPGNYNVILSSKRLDVENIPEFRKRKTNLHESPFSLEITNMCNTQSIFFSKLVL